MTIGTYEVPDRPLTNGTANPAIYNPFKKAEKRQVKLRMALSGPSGSGKTYTMLRIAKRIIEREGGRIAVIDTEHGSAAKYSDEFDFDHIDLSHEALVEMKKAGIDVQPDAVFSPVNYIQLLRTAQAAGYTVIIIDSLSHAWNGKGGLLEYVDQLTTASKSGASFQAWAKATPLQNALVEAILSSKAHVFAGMRSKTEYVLDLNEKGKTAPRKVGTAPIQRDGIEYEFDVTADLDLQNKLIIDKTRCSALKGRLFDRAGAEIADILLDWASAGKEQEAPKTESAPVDDPRVALLAKIASREKKLEEMKVKGFLNAKEIAKTRTEKIGSPLFDQASMETLEKYNQHLFDTYTSINTKAN